MSPSEVLPGPKKRQAQAVFENVEWMGKKFGDDTLGFLTLTAGDKVNGRFVKIADPDEFQRRLNSLLTNVIRRHYRCGVIVIEPHKDGTLHAHIVCAVGADIRSGFDHGRLADLEQAVKAGKRRAWRARECGANAALSAEWAFWRRTAPRYGFGRANLQPVRANGQAVARYVAKYITKGFTERRAEHKGMRMARYFGNWQSADEQARVESATDAPSKAAPRFSARRGVNTPRARAWRECVRQIAFCSRGQLTQDTVKQCCGQRWAMTLTRQMRATTFLVGESARWSASLREAMTAHNTEVAEEWRCAARAVWERHAAFWQRDEFDSEVPVWLHALRLDNQSACRRAVAWNEIRAGEYD